MPLGVTELTGHVKVPGVVAGLVRQNILTPARSREAPEVRVAHGALILPAQRLAETPALLEPLLHIMPYLFLAHTLLLFPLMVK